MYVLLMSKQDEHLDITVVMQSILKKSKIFTTNLHVANSFVTIFVNILVE